MCLYVYICTFYIYSCLWMLFRVTHPIPCRKFFSEMLLLRTFSRSWVVFFPSVFGTDHPFKFSSHIGKRIVTFRKQHIVGFKSVSGVLFVWKHWGGSFPTVWSWLVVVSVEFHCTLANVSHHSSWQLFGMHNGWTTPFFLWGAPQLPLNRPKVIPDFQQSSVFYHGKRPTPACSSNPLTFIGASGAWTTMNIFQLLGMAGLWGCGWGWPEA